ncbi:MAG: hypothetical protein ACHQRM_10745 [Bacteroidia bacterium]
MDELARLILSLTKAEKRYFKMFTSLQSGEKDYLKLFEAIEKQDEYDEEKIKKQFAKDDFIKRLPAVKNYLYAQILKSLRVLHAGNSIRSRLKEMLEDISNLFEKRLYKQCLKYVEKAKEVAKKNELFPILAELQEWEEKVLLELLDLERLEMSVNSTLAEEHFLMELRKNTAVYRNLYNRMVLINKRIREARTEDELGLFSEVMSHPLLKSEEHAGCFESKNYFYHIHLLYNHAKGDNKACLQIALKQLQLIESFPDKMEENPKMHISALQNILLGQIHTHEYNDFYSILTKLRSITLHSLSLEVSRFVNSTVFEMVMCLDTGEFEKSRELRPALLDGLKKFNDKLNPIEKSTLLYNLFYSYFGTREYSKALEIINQLLNKYEKELRYDLQGAIRIVNLILHYELKNTFLLEHIAVSTYRFLIKSKRLYKFENIVLNFIRRKMPDIYTPKDEILAFRELRKQIIELMADPYERKAFEYFDYISWLDSKIEGQTFEYIVKMKFQEKYSLVK